MPSSQWRGDRCPVLSQLGWRVSGGTSQRKQLSALPALHALIEPCCHELGDAPSAFDCCRPDFATHWRLLSPAAPSYASLRPSQTSKLTPAGLIDQAGLIDLRLHCRETLGSDTCDARRGVTDLGSQEEPDCGPCAFEQGEYQAFCKATAWAAHDIIFPMSEHGIKMACCWPYLGSGLGG